MADGDYERGRGREIDAIAAELKRLAAARRKCAAPDSRANTKFACSEFLVGDAKISFGEKRGLTTCGGI